LISENTLFVLGAGASAPYGLPLGSELRTLTCDMGNQNNAVIDRVLQDGEFTLGDIRRLSRIFLESNVPSIDAFLETQHHLLDIGKALIAAIISSKEDPNKISSEHTQDHWYRQLWSVLRDDNLQGAELRRNSVRFITFIMIDHWSFFYTHQQKPLMA